MLALISTNPFQLLKTFNADIADVNIPDKWQAQRVVDGYQTPDGKYKLVTIVSFVPPNGQQITGLPTYSIDPVTGIVSQIFTTQAIPPVIFIPFQTFVGRLTDVEYTNIKKAIANQITAGNATVARWYDRATANGISTTDPQTAVVKAAAISAGLLTQPRADIVFTP